MLSNEVRTIVGVPEYYLDEYNSTAMQNYWCIVSQLIDIFDPEVICEIGSERGITTRKLIEWAAQNDRMVHSADPSLSEELSRSQHFLPFRMPSLEYLKDNQANFYFLDGEHNYYTVINELRAIERHFDRRSPLCILLHDVSWPCTRRDMYYHPEDIPTALAHDYDTAVILENEQLATRGFGGGSVFAWARQHGGSENGVLTAVDDFVSTSDLAWHYWQIPNFYGLGCLWHVDTLSLDKHEQMRAIEAAIKQLQPLLAIAEANRLRLYQGLMEHQDDLQKTISELRFYSRIPIVGHFIRLIGRLTGRSFRY